MSEKVEEEAKGIKLTEEEAKEIAKGAELLLPIETLLSAGVHIGTRIKTKDMETFVFRVRPDGLFVLDVKRMDERLRTASKFIARYDPSKVVVVSVRLYGQSPVKKFCDVTRCRPVLGRFMPGLFSNPSHPNHLDPGIVLVTDPKADEQAVREASGIGVPVIGLCDTDNSFTDVDFVIPTNNKGRRALATVFWLLARQVLKERGEIPPDGELTATIDDFETKLEEAGPVGASGEEE